MRIDIVVTCVLPREAFFDSEKGRKESSRSGFGILNHEYGTSQIAPLHGAVLRGTTGWKRRPKRRAPRASTAASRPKGVSPVKKSR